MADTIFALATPPGRSAVAVVRISGPQAQTTLTALAGAPPPPRALHLRSLHARSGALLDRGLVTWSPGPASYTGEDCAELHLHGGLAVVDQVVQALADLGLRLAEPGEFTRRAFENGKLDLAQAEGVADLIDAETDAQRRQALSQLGGALSVAHARWRHALIESLALFEAAVDFPDEELPEDVAARARPLLQALLGELETAREDVERGRRVREGYKVALLGAPNAGKSTLLNGLSGREAAIVHARPGTTRDVIEVPLILAGYKVLLADTAGLREASDEIEAEGMRRARAWALEADLRLWVVDGSSNVEPDFTGELQPGDFCLVSKLDLGEGGAADAAEALAERGGLGVMRISARCPEDIERVRCRVERQVAAVLTGTESPTATRVRHRAQLVEAIERLRRADGAAEPELAAEDVRLAARALDRIVGRVDPEAVLDRIFSTFCIGK